MPDSLRSFQLGCQRTPEGVPTFVRQAGGLETRKRPHRRGVLHHVPAECLPDDRGAGLFHAPPRRQVDDRLSVRGPPLLGSSHSLEEAFMAPQPSRLSRLWSAHDSEWRDPAQVISQWSGAGSAAQELLRFPVRVDWWDVLAEHKITLLVTREYEHLVIALSPRLRRRARHAQTYLPLPHPSGLPTDRRRGAAYVARTRNPNQVYDLAPVSGLVDRSDVPPLGERYLSEFRPF